MKVGGRVGVMRYYDATLDLAPPFAVTRFGWMFPGSEPLN
jgi:hypothetical protein